VRRAARRAPRTALLVGAALALALASGCGEKPRSPVTVRGQVKREDGKPLPPISLAFHPQDRANRLMPTAVPDVKDGTFEVRCLPGKYKVTLAPLQAAEDDPARAKDGKTGAPAPGGNLRLPARYQSASDTDWAVEVPATGKDDLVLRLGFPKL